MKRTTVSERAVVLAPRGRDAALAVTMLADAGIASGATLSLPTLLLELGQGAGVVVVTEEALATADLAPLAAWIADQEEWSDLPFVLLTSQGGGLERNPAARRYLDVLGNATFIERPFHPTTLVSLVRAALRGRRKQYEARSRLLALREGERRYRALFDAIDEGFCVIEFIDGPHGPLSDYVHVEANTAYERHAGIPNVVGRQLREMVGDEAGGWIELYRRVLETGESIRFERELIATGRYLDLAAFRVEPATRKQVAVLFQDVTPRRRAEAELRSLNETLETRVAEALAGRKVFADVVEGTDAFVQVADLDYRWLAINKASAQEFERIYGVRPRAGDSMLELLAHRPEHQAAVRAVWSRALSGEEFTETTDYGDPALDRRSYEMKFNALRDAGGGLIGAYQFVYDVTDRMRDQDRLVDAQEQLRQAQKMEALGQLTGGVAHDFNNLLTIIKSSAYLLNRPTIQEDRRQRYLQTISSTVDRAAKLTGQLLAFARRQALKPEVFDIGSRIRDIGDMLRTVVGSRVELHIELSPEACFVEADANQFETALVNMVLNGRDAMDEQGRLDITVSDVRHASSGFVAVAIRDTGSGIAPDRVAHIFEPFFTTKEVGKGTGLGLSQAYGFAKQSGGELSVESEIGRGTTFTLLLPRADRPAPAEPPAPADTAPAESPLGDGRRVLVVEDNADVGMFSSQLLRDLGYETVWAPDALEALRLLDESQRYHAVFSDVVMPGMSGIELGHEIHRRHPHLPVILTSGYSHVLAQEGRHGFELLQKPYAVEELSRVLRELPAGPRPTV